MKASNKNIEASILVITRYLVKQICIVCNCNEDKALSSLIKTATYELLQDIHSKLYAESPEYVFSLLKDELRGDIDSWLSI